jgi:hypothetical protein
VRQSPWSARASRCCISLMNVSQTG